MPPSPSWLKAGARPLGLYEERARATDIDRPEEETVLLAPRLDLTPGGSPRGEEGDVDIASPFAEPEKAPVTELMSLTPRLEVDADESMAFFEGSVTPFRRPSEMHFELTEPLTEPKTESGRSKPVVSPIDPPPIDPLLTKPRPMRPVPAPVDAAKSELSLRRRPILNVGNDTLEVADPAQKSPSTLSSVRPATDDPSRLRRRPVGGIPLPDRKISDVAIDIAPVGSPPPGRLRLATETIGEAWGDLVAAYARDWAAYSRWCLATEARLSQLAGLLLVKSGRLAALTGSAAIKLSRAGLLALQVGADHAFRAAKSAVTVGSQTCRHTLAILQPALASAAKSARSIAVSAGAVTIRETRRGAVASVRAMRASGVALHQTAKATSTRLAMILEKQRDVLARATKAASALAAPSPAAAATSGSAGKRTDKSASSPSPIQSTAGPRAANSPKAAADKPTTSGPSSHWQRVWAFLSTLRPPRPAIVGFAALSVAIFLIALVTGQTPTPTEAELIFPIPERPSATISQSSIFGKAAIAAEPTGSVSIAIPRPLPVLDAPLAELAAYVNERSAIRAAASTDGLDPLLAKAKSTEGLGQFIWAAELVGLEDLLQPDETYTIFAPNDAAFAQLDPGELGGLLEPAGHERLRTLLSHHVFRELLTFDEFAGDVREYRSLANKTVTIDATAVVSVGGAGMVESDLQTENGVLHVIDQVLPIDEP